MRTASVVTASTISLAGLGERNDRDGEVVESTLPVERTADCLFFLETDIGARNR
jgi:hypothetical protein